MTPETITPRQLIQRAIARDPGGARQIGLIVPEPFEPTVEMPVVRTEPWPVPGIPRASRRPGYTSPPVSQHATRGEMALVAVCVGVVFVFGMLFAAGLVAVAERMAAGGGT